MSNLSRKDIARLLDVSVDQVRKNEKEWGIRRCRITFNMRFIRYRKEKTVEILRERGLLLDAPQVPQLPHDKPMK